MTKKDLLSGIPDAGGMDGKNYEEIIKEIVKEQPAYDETSYLLREPQATTQETKQSNKKDILFYAGIAIVIGIVAFIIIKKCKK